MSVSSRLRAELPMHYKVFFSVYFFFQACRMQTLQLFYVLVTPLIKGHWGPKHLERNANHKTALLFIIFCWTFPGLNLFLFQMKPLWVSRIFLSILAEPNRHAFFNRPNAQDISEALRPLLSSTGTVPRAPMTIYMIHRAVTKGQEPGTSPTYYEHDPCLLLYRKQKENSTKRTSQPFSSRSYNCIYPWQPCTYSCSFL